MAAILCNGLSGLCTNAGDLICLPCKACGLGCDMCCKMMCGPFFPYLAVTFVLNLPCIVYGAKALTDFRAGAQCISGLEWLMINAVLSAVHIAAAIYIVEKIRDDAPSQKEMEGADFQLVEPVKAKPVEAKIPAATVPGAVAVGGAPQDMKKSGKGKDDGSEIVTEYRQMAAMEEAQGYTTTTTVTHIPAPSKARASNNVFDNISMGPESDAPAMSCGRIKHILCHDCVVAIYIVIALFWLFWQSIGTPRYLELAADGDFQCGNTEKAIAISLTCGWMYGTLAIVGFLCSMCCLRSKRY
mmetsp:Transcript_38589/g.57364  ORF Transcript_38589/g.57364 Transcript_38589/m.57364 type:complete len:299 (-) Transcript_38589:97-993(-)|eukprot:CAMPEP_0194029730 /NCGR_PEP_ID=MMETSP0009_2-20130614/3391_1 /TAXON_ID=210454 /ORGANISM="Grammatophora oceanica, Strain CCMP 410" /LENGTH=298 /DNA_ID=CAMNT_0038669487 /DNA_START=58 /DNA_END=954 /DNA_ORIENTATION=-